jgi:hypothetical protein
VAAPSEIPNIMLSCLGMAELWQPSVPNMV